MDEFKKFSQATDLKAHPEKCKLYFGGVHVKERKDILAATRFSEGVLPFKYLSVSLSSKKLIVQQWRPLVDRIIGKVKHWTTRLLTCAGRYPMIKSVLFIVTTYWMQVSSLEWNKLNQYEEVIFGVDRMG